MHRKVESLEQTKANNKSGPTNLVTLTKKVYGVEKRPKVHVVNKWDCRSTSRRENQPGRRTSLRKRLFSLDLATKEASTLPVAKKESH